MTASQIPTGDRIVGVDAGGTLVRLAVSQPGAPLSEALVMTTPASEDGGPEPLISLLKLAPLDPSKVLGAVAGVTKVSRPGVTDRWEDLLRAVFPNATLRVVPDFQIAYHGAVSGGIGVAALAGTGSVIYGEDAQGNRARVGGRGWEYGDEGSGAWLTTEALRRTLRALDGFETSATLARLVGGYLKETEDAGRLAQSAR
ncbi:MAG: hypothetical protein H7Z41_06160, partial [Cytophagales bacterium]|nr:hypothetical protein [Armatimonadota bacterium]